MNYPTTAIIEVHHAGAWHPAVELQALGHNRVRFSYLDEYVFGNIHLPVSLTLPVGLWPEPKVQGLTGLEPDHRPPSFLYDLVPQGKGRKFLLATLNLPDSDEMIMPLVMAGAFNPIGCLRLDTAMNFYAQEAVKNPDPQMTDGVSLDDITQRSDEFLNHISQHSMLATGTTGVQGVAPKFLLTTDKNGRWFADTALPDDRAHEHWLVKLPRGKSDEDRAVLRNEAAYLRVADAVGLRCKYAPVLRGEMLFVRRFDREVTQGGGVQHLHQESLASVIGQRGFGMAQSQQSLVAGIRRVVTDAAGETLEFIKRDVLNLALRNTDNHARNTAVQRTTEGIIQLTPVFDFAPMFKDPELVSRSCHWRDKAGVRQADWKQVIEQLEVPDHERASIAAELAVFAKTVARLDVIARDCGVDPDVLNQCSRSIETQARQLEDVTGTWHG
jgi:serine/threonine-protein kinase HipA